MNKTIKYFLVGLGSLIVLALIAVVIIAASFNPNDYKPLVIKMVKEQKQRTLTIDGDIKLAFWPKIGADLGHVSISEHKSDKEFAAIQSAKVFLSVIPLLKNELVIDTIYVDGAKANIVRFKDGSTNFDDLMSKQEASEEEIKLNIDGIEVSNAALNLSDEMSNRHISINSLDLTTGPIAKGEPIDLETQFHLLADNPKLNVKTQVKGRLLADPESQLFTAKNLDALLQGDVDRLKELDFKISGDFEAKPETAEFLLDGLKLEAKANLDGQALVIDMAAPSLVMRKDEVGGNDINLTFKRGAGDDVLNVSLAIDDIKGSSKAFESSGIVGEISGKQAARTLSGKFSSPIVGNLETQVFELPKLVGKVDITDPALPKGEAKIGFDLNARADLKQKLAAAGLTINIDDSNIKGKLDVTGFEKPKVKFDLSADQIDLNKLLGKSQASAKPAATKSGGDLNALKDVLLQGSINIGDIIYEQYHVANLKAAIKADGKTLSVSPLSLKLDDSQIKGRLGVSRFSNPIYSFDIDIDRLDADRYMPKDSGQQAKSDGGNSPLDLSALKSLNTEGSLRIGSLKSGEINASNIRIDVKADGKKLNVNPLSLKLDESSIKARLGITRFENPVFNFNLDIDRLDADRYITKSESTTTKTGDTPLDLSALKMLNASGEVKVRQLKLANVKTSNVKLVLKAADGLVALSPFSANLYQGAMTGFLNVDARAIPAIAFKQEMKNITIGPLLADAIKNGMLDGKGNLSVDVKTQGATVGTLKKALEGNAAISLADGAIKGFDFIGTINDAKTKLNALKSKSTLGSEKSKKTEFSEMKATFVIKEGVAHNDDLAIKAPLFRIAGSGDIDIGNEKLDYLAKPTIVSSLKGQGGKEVSALDGMTIPVKLTGTFSEPKYGLDFAAIGTALAKQKLLGKVGGSKGESVQKLLSGDDKVDALKGLLGGKKQKAPAAAPENTENGTTEQPPAAPPPSSTEEKAKKKLKNMLGF